MNDGGGENGKESDLKTSKYAAGSNEFVRAIARIAVAQVCENAGFQSSQQSALEALADVAVRYIREIGRNAHCYANLAGRTESDALDVIQGLEDLGLTWGILGSSDVHRCLAASNTVRELIQYINLNEDIPFAYSLPRFPVLRERNPKPSFLEIGQDSPGEHIPVWLPAFPDPSTYVRLGRGIDKENDHVADGVEQVREEKKEEQSVTNLLRQPVSNNGPLVVLATDLRDGLKGKRAAEYNPFLAPPLQFGEKDVSSIVLPARLPEEAALMNRPSAIETFVLDGEDGKCSLFKSEEGRNKILLHNRPTVRVKLNRRRKFLATSMNSFSPENEVERMDSCSESCNEKDKEKRRGNHVLKEAMEISQELAQL
ncbi:hypothetical protein Ancab_018334 [Ancistrocladus abbreviatus]